METGGVKGERREAKVPETPVWVPTLEVHGEARAAKLAATRRWVRQRFVATKTPSNWHKIRHPFAATDVGVVGSAVSSKSSQRCLRSEVRADRLLAGERTGSGGRGGDKHTNPPLDLRTLPHQVFDKDFVPSAAIPFVRHVGKNRRDTKKDTCVSASQCKQGHGNKHNTTRAHVFARKTLPSLSKPPEDQQRSCILREDGGNRGAPWAI